MDSKQVIELLIGLNVITESSPGDYSVNALEVNKLKKEENEKKLRPIEITPDTMFRNFLRDAQIPYEAITASGQKFILTKKSGPTVAKLFNLVVTNKCSYESLVYAARTFYGDPAMFKCTVTTFFKDAMYESILENSPLPKDFSITVNTGKPKFDMGGLGGISL